MYRISIFLIVLFLHHVVFNLHAQQVAFSKKETLYSVQNGRSIGDLALSIEIKSLDANPKEFYLVVGERGNDIIDSPKKDRTIWLFNRTSSLNDLKRNVRNLDITLDAKGYREFAAFSENDVKFELKAWDELRKQARYVFFVDDATPGKEVQLKLHFYIATVEKKKTVIDDDTRLSLTFTVPEPVRATVAAAATAAGNRGGQQAEEISLTERAGMGGGAAQPRTIEQIMEEQEEENRRKALSQAEELAQRTEELNVFITVKNKEIAAVVTEIEEMPKMSRKDRTRVLDSLELVISEMKKRVDYYDKGYTDILLKQEDIQGKFTKFTTDHTIATKLLTGKREELSAWQKMIMPVAMGFSALMMGLMLMMQVMSRIKAKKSQMMMMKNMAKTIPGVQQAQQMQKMQPKKAPPKKVREIDLIDINDLEQI